MSRILPLINELCAFPTGVMAPTNESFFERIALELNIKIRRYLSGTTYNGWVVPDQWSVERARILKDDCEVFNCLAAPLGVASYSRSFQGELDFEELKHHLVTNPTLPGAYVFHCMWQYRPWDADWAFSVPYETYRSFGPGRYTVDLVTTYSPGEMLVAVYDHKGRSNRTVVFNAHTCHPCMANDDFAGVAVLVRLFQWLRGQDTYYTYRLILGPEHLGTIFYLHDLDDNELQRIVGGAFAEMPGTRFPIKVAASFLGNQPIDKAFRNAARHHTSAYEFVPWRQGAGNDETVWEAPGYEIPFVEVSRCRHILDPYPEYHTSLDGPDLMDDDMLDEFYDVFVRAIGVLERNSRVYRKFNGLICLSNPQYDLYLERPDPAVQKDLTEDSEKWGHLLDCLFRYFDGSMTVLDIAERHDLPFEPLYHYIRKFEENGLVRLEFSPIERLPISRPI